jgi:ribosomal protein L40E
MKCPKCQLENPDEAKFCNQYANKLEVTCPECGKVNPLGSKFCNQCSYDFKKVKEAPAIDYSQPLSYTPNPSLTRSPLPGLPWKENARW